MHKLTKQDGASLDMTDENLKALKTIFPEAFTEDGIDFDVLRQLLGGAVADGEEKYGLTWYGKKRARQIALTPSMGTLRPCPEESVDWETTQNLFIEGDNLEVLKLLQKSYANKVKMIYIDPPYNTGKEFIYPDKFQDNLDTYLRYTGQKDDEGFKISSNTESSGRYHTNWLNMIYPRLKLSKNLLCDKGVIFISVDDIEVANLRKACDEIFGEHNFIANIVWQKKYTRANDAKWFSDNHDHILCYAKNKELFRVNQLPRTDDQLTAYKNPDNHPKGMWKATPLHAKSGTNNSSYTFSNGVKWAPPPGTFRRFNDQTMKKMDEEDEIWFGEDGTKTPQRKSFLCDVKDGVTPITLWPYDEVGHNHEANSELKALGLSGVFNNPKPSRLINRMITLSENENNNGVILDFFAGSCATAQAVLQANVNGRYMRRFIMVQLPEPCDEKSVAYKEGLKTIADIGKERTRRAASKIKQENPEYNGDLGFKVFKLDSSNIRAWQPDRDDLEETLFDQIDHLVQGRSEQDILYELLLKRGVELTAPIEEKTIAGKTVYSIGFGVLLACLDKSIDRNEVEELAQGIIDWHKELEPAIDTQIVFRDSTFKDDIAKTNMAAILEQSGIVHVRSL